MLALASHAIKAFFAGIQLPQAPRRRPRRHLGSSDTLEQRQLLAAVMWDGQGPTDDWNDSRNWTDDTLPGPTDDVIIDFGANDFSSP